MFSGLGYTEMILVGVIAIMLFGSRLPDVARNFGATYRQLRNKVDEFQREFRDWERMDHPPSRPTYSEDEQVETVEPKTPKFIAPPPAEPSSTNEQEEKQE